MASQPAAFMSYVRFNDRHDDGQLSQFRERLASEIRVQTGEEFPIFQDRNDIAWGQNWRHRIEETLDAVTLLLTIITPSFFRSPACRAELERFLAREQKLGRQDLILPVYYVSTPELDDPERRDADPLASAVASRQFADWRELRFEPFTSPAVRRTLAQLASRMRDTSWRQDLGQGPTRPKRPASQGPAHRPTVSKMLPTSTVPKVEPPTHVVDAYERGDFATISAAIDAARPGDRILVRPGLYREGLVINKPLEIVGDGPLADIEIRAQGADAIFFRANIGRVANLTLRQDGGAGTWFGVDITQGRLDLEGCDISSQSLSAVAIGGGADPRLRRNVIHGARQSGVYVFNNGLGTLEDNDIASNAFSGVTIATGGNPTIRRNQIHHNEGAGIYVYDEGLGTLEDNDITANAKSGVAIRTGGAPTIRNNRINENEYEAVWIRDGGRGTIKDNDLTQNKRGPWDIEEDSLANVERARNKER